MASASLLTTPTTKPVLPSKYSSYAPHSSAAAATVRKVPANALAGSRPTSRRHLMAVSLANAAGVLLSSSAVLTPPALASSDEEYTNETSEVINKVRSTINMDKSDPNVAAAVAELREAANSWVAKYRREKDLLGRPSFRDVYSALNAVSGHYISFGPTAPIPAKRKARILEEMDTAEKALLRGR